MKKNMGTLDRVIRGIIAVVAIALYATGTVTGTWGVILIIAAAVFLVTSMVSFCPLYLPLGLNTIRKKLNN